MIKRFILLAVILTPANTGYAYPLSSSFISVQGHQLFVNKHVYHFVGANYWYGGLLGLGKDKKRGVERLRRELDFLKAQGVTNLRLLGGAEGSGLMNGVDRVGPSLQPEQGKFDENTLDGLDLVLAEMSKRQMRAVIFLSNNWEWSGGFLQYLIWNHVIPDEWLAKKPSWDELRDNVAKFYACQQCKDDYDKQVRLIINRRNRYTNTRYTGDPTIMAWELANEPRPMRPFANEDYQHWIVDTARMIKMLDPNHLVTIGHEGWIGTESLTFFEKAHADKNIDYLTIHIWPKNWGWFADGKMSEGFSNIIDQSVKYVAENIAVAKNLNKPLVIEEFGLPRDVQSLDPFSRTSFRDQYYAKILSFVGGRSGGNEYIAGANFWALGGIGRPKKGQMFWKQGDDYLGDPPMEAQGLNSVFDSDRSTWGVIRSAARSIR